MGGKEHKEILESIRACDRPVVVLTGAARSGKTDAAIGLYEAYLSDPTAPACGLIVPNYLAVHSLRRRLLERAPGGVLVAPLVMTFASLAERIAQAAGRSHRRISPTGRRAVLAGIIASLAGRGELKVLAAVADTPGLVAAVDRGIAELKRAAVEPDALAEALRGTNGRHADLLTVYRAYQAWLLAHDLYDEEGRMWRAREDLAAMAAGPIPGLRAVAVDGFTDFTPTQLGILRVLAGRVERVVITLPYVDERRRRKLWRWTERQLGRIRNAFGELAVQMELPDPTDGPAATLLESVFSTEPPRAPWPEGLACVEAADPESECRAIARWVKAHLAAGARPDELAVLARGGRSIAPALRRVFREAGLPAPAAEGALLETGAARALMAVVTMACGFDSPDVLNVLTCSYVDPACLGPFGPDTLDAAQLAIRLENVLGGRDRYAPAAAGLAGRLARRAPDDPYATPQETYLRGLGPEVLAAAADLFEALFARVDAIAAGGAPAAMAAACRALVGTLLQPGRGIEADADLAEDLRAWSALAAVLDDLAAAEASDGGAGRPMTAPLLRQWLTAVLAETAAPAAASPAAVRVTDVLDGRSLRAAHVWIAAVNEGVFPAPAGEGALIGEADRQRWIRQHQLPLDSRDDQAAREMLLFYLTCARADRTLTISYHSADADGGAAAASAFVDALLAPVPPAERAVAALPLAEFAPPPERILSWREFRNAAAACEGDGQAWQPAVDHGLLAALARPLWAAYRRWAAQPPDRYDGVLDDPALLAELAATVPACCVLSVSRLNDYLACPWAYFAQRHLRLEPLANPTDDWMPRSRGQLVHAILQRLTAALTADGPVAAASMAEPRVLEILDEAIAAEAARTDGSVRCRGLWDSELRRLRRALADYLADQAARALPAQHILSQEWSFGMGLHGAPPIELDGPAGVVRLQGRIDRVDRIDSGGQPKALVIDYKTGVLPSVAADVQLPVYIRAAEQLGDLPVAGGAFHGIGGKAPQQRYLAEVSLSRGKVAVDDRYAERLAAAEANVHAAVAGIAAGRFGLAAGGGACTTTHCPFRRVCGHNDVRLERKVVAREDADG
ncbi:MAG: hypothetical protein GX591_14835 [Planctomycetes bacterium]|nr:hypothetical protein [Planctomycetota bacterium]